MEESGKPIVYDELSWVAARDLVEGGMDMAIMPTGATEQHGPHLPMNVDYLVAYRIALGVSGAQGSRCCRRCLSAIRAVTTGFRARFR